MINIVRSMWKYILFAIIILIVRSPILMFITGFMFGIATYHNYPDKVRDKIENVTTYIEEQLKSSMVEKNNVTTKPEVNIIGATLKDSIYEKNNN